MKKKMELTSKQKGNLTELQCITALCAAGCHISIPYGENSRYDLIADYKGQLLKIQVKTSSLINKDETNAIQFSCRSSYVNCSGVKNIKYTEQEIDFFATFWEGKCYLIPIKECSSSKTLRFNYPKSGQIKGISFAEDYELNKQLKKLEEVIKH